MTKKPTLQEEIINKSDREIQQEIAYAAILNQRHLSSIRSSLNWILGIIILGIIISFVMAIGAAGAL